MMSYDEIIEPEINQPEHDHEDHTIQNQYPTDLDQDPKFRHTGTQTEMTEKELCEVFEKLESALSQKLQKMLDNLLFKPESFIDNDEKTKYFTGLTSYKVLFEIHKIIDPYLSNTQRTAISTFQQLIITLVKLRLNYSFQCFSYR